MYTLSPVGGAATGFQKSLKKQWKYSSASDIDSVYAPRVSDDEGMLICLFTWWGRPYGRGKNWKKKFTRARQMNITLHPVEYLHHI